MVLTIVILIWIVCGVLNYGLMMAYWQKKYPGIAKENYLSDRTEALIQILGGPICLISLTFFRAGRGAAFKYGFLYRNPHK